MLAGVWNVVSHPLKRFGGCRLNQPRSKILADGRPTTLFKDRTLMPIMQWRLLLTSLQVTNKFELQTFHDVSFQLQIVVKCLPC